MISGQNIKITHEAGTQGTKIRFSISGQELVADIPVRLHLGPVEQLTKWLEYGYSSVEERHNALVGKRLVEVAGAIIDFEDTIAAVEDEIRITRKVRILKGASEKGQGFMTDFSLAFLETLEKLDWFAPGLWYLKNEYVPYYSFGSKGLLDEGIVNYCYFREDRLSAPLLGFYDPDRNCSFVILHSDPSGRTLGSDDEVKPLVDGGMEFGSLGIEMRGQNRIGFWYPGTECEVAYPPRDWSYSVMWNDQLSQAKQGVKKSGSFGRDLAGIFRFHPMETGFEQNYTLRLKTFASRSYPQMVQQAWRYAWQVLKPPMIPAPLHQVEDASINLLSSLVREEKGIPGIPFALDIFSDELERPVFAIGFVGRNIQSSYYLIRAGHAHGKQELIDQGQRIIDFWVASSGVGRLHARYNFQLGAWQDHGEENGRLEVYLRPLAEGYLACLRAWQEERKHGVEHPAWLQWVVDFGNWLLATQNPDGSFYRMYFSDGEPAWKVTTGCFSVIPFLTALEEATGNQAYLHAALRVGHFLWQNFQKDGHFIGGTIDNPSVYDKEAAAISLEAYLALYSRTGDPAWLEAAKQAADFTETWIYIWNIPLPEDGGERHWRTGASTVGMQLVCTGHSLCDMYLAFNCGEYAQLWKYTGDEHYLEVARLLLHNTKQLIWLDSSRALRPGYQQEHWTFSIGRGLGRHSNWLPWVTTSHLVGMENYKNIIGSYGG
jgi:hypothetical protein